MLVRKFAPPRLTTTMSAVDAAEIATSLETGEPPCCILQGLAYARGADRCSVLVMDAKADFDWATLELLGDLCVRLHDYGFMRMSRPSWDAASQCLLELIPLLDRILDGYNRAEELRRPMPATLDFSDAVAQLTNGINELQRVQFADPVAFSVGWAAVFSQTKLLCTKIAEKIEAAFPPPQ